MTNVAFRLAMQGSVPRRRKAPIPYVGEAGKRHYEKELRLEVVVPDYRLADVLRAMHVRTLMKRWPMMYMPLKMNINK
ncbi:MAG: hypothetical protein U5L96_12250 [Owenweeksia sp.]|nr:hypothetical protein [Owenweeksia sp.]